MEENFNMELENPSLWIVLNVILAVVILLGIVIVGFKGAKIPENLQASCTNLPQCQACPETPSCSPILQCNQTLNATPICPQPIVSVFVNTSNSSIIIQNTTNFTSIVNQSFNQTIYINISGWHESMNATGSYIFAWNQTGNYTFLVNLTSFILNNETNST